MKRFLVALLAVGVLAGCAQGTPPTDKVNGGGSWYTLTDPVTGVELRCHVLKSSTSHSYDVYTESCYKP